jgi:hypothetical protein
MGFSPGDFSIPALKRVIKAKPFPSHECGGFHQEVHPTGLAQSFSAEEAAEKVYGSFLGGSPLLQQGGAGL